MSCRYVALDIETCPLPLDDLAPAQHERFTRRVLHNGDRRPGEDDAAVAERVRATDPALAWICCIGVVSVADPLEERPVRTYTAACPDEEAAMLRAFWGDVAVLASLRVSLRWITFNGKDFDVPRLLLRSAAHGIAPVRCGLLDTYPYRHRPHCDLMRLLGGKQLSLDALCAVLGVASPKAGAVSADGVSEAVSTGSLDALAAYCAADVAATLACFARLIDVEGALSHRFT